MKGKKKSLAKHLRKKKKKQQKEQQKDAKQAGESMVGNSSWSWTDTEIKLESYDKSFDGLSGRCNYSTPINPRPLF